MSVNRIAALWGLTEATFFFLVPDVILTYDGALRGIRAGLTACGFALAGALVGGTLTFILGAGAPDAIFSSLAHLPGISSGLIADVQTEVGTSGICAMVLGPLTGTPYKIYAAVAGAQGVSYPLFLAASVAARLPRFAGATVIAAWLAPRHPAPALRRRIQIIWLVLWVAFYAVYFSVMPN